MEVVVGGNTWDAHPQGEWADWRLRAELYAGHFDVVFGRVDWQEDHYLKSNIQYL